MSGGTFQFSPPVLDWSWVGYASCRTCHRPRRDLIDPNDGLEWPETPCWECELDTLAANAVASEPVPLPPRSWTDHLERPTRRRPWSPDPKEEGRLDTWDMPVATVLVVDEGEQPS